jgi:hypothetical protein
MATEIDQVHCYSVQRLFRHSNEAPALVSRIEAVTPSLFLLEKADSVSGTEITAVIQISTKGKRKMTLFEKPIGPLPIIAMGDSFIFVPDHDS